VPNRIINCKVSRDDASSNSASNEYVTYKTCDVQEMSVVKQFGSINFQLETFCCGYLKERNHVVSFCVHGIILK